MLRVVLKVDCLDNIHIEEGEGARRYRRVGRSSSLKKGGLIPYLFSISLVCGMRGPPTDRLRLSYAHAQLPKR